VTNIAVFASGHGTNFQAIIDGIESGYIKNAKIALCLVDRKEAGALDRAEKHGIPTAVVERDVFASQKDFEDAIANETNKVSVDLILLAGFMKILSPTFISQYQRRIMNIHPALLPSFGGKGLYGLKVHQAVLDYGTKITGCTVHFVDEECDHGPIIIQAPVPVQDDDTPETLAKRVLEQEHKIYPEAVRLYCEGKLEITGRRVLRR
jgi:phosphoribosylglycinamide formyltransferase-1